MGQEPVDSAIVTQYCTDLLTEAREKGFIGKLRTQIKQANWEEARNILQEIKVLSPDNCMASVRLVSGDGKLIDQVGDLISLQSAAFIVQADGSEYVLGVMIALKPNNPRSFNIGWAGIPGSGKTSLLHRIKFGVFGAFKPTIGLGLQNINFEGHEISNIDISGDELLRNRWLVLMKDEIAPDMLFYFVDSADDENIDEAKDFLKELVEIPHFQYIPMIIVAAKQDLDGSMSKNEIIERMLLEDLMNGRDWFVVPSSSKTGLGLDEILFTLSDVLIKENA